jgi:hypothetical protein
MGWRLLIAYWPFAVNEYLAIRNAALPHRGAAMSGDEKASGSELISRASILLVVASG